MSFDLRPHGLMVYRFYFSGGPLDGMILEGRDDCLPTDWEDLGAIVYRETHGGLVGATFDIFNPHLLFEQPERQYVWLYSYRLAFCRLEKPATQIHVSYDGPTNRAIGANANAFKRWAQG